MIALRPALHDYLAMRRALGYKLQRTEKLLADFVAFVEASGNEHVTIDLALAWATLPAHGAMDWWAGRLTVASGFATYVHTLDPATEVPPKDLLPARTHRAVPYLYSDSDIAALMHAAKNLASPSSVLTYQTLIPLLAVTGMRIGEAIRLDRSDLDLGAGVLTVRMSKFGKSRELPLHPSTVEAFRCYLSERDQLHPSPNTPSLFVSAAGTRLMYCSVQRIFQRLVRQAGLVPRSTLCRPRLHDLRHSFAVRILTDAYRTDADVAALLPRLSTYLGHGHPANTYGYLSAAPELLALAAPTVGAQPPGAAMSALAPTLQAFFTDRLARQRQASPETVAAYRDGLRLLVCFASRQVRKEPSQLDIGDLDAPLISAFLDSLEQRRRNTVRTRNARLAAIHSLFRYAALRHPEHAALIQRVLAIPPKRFDRALINFLSSAEIVALLASPDRSTRTGRRDYALLLLAIQTGLRASELTALTCSDIHLGTGPHVCCRGKGRKDRITPLTTGTVTTLKVWLAERAGGPTDPVFATHRGHALTRDAIERRLAHYTALAAERCPSLHPKRVSAHVLRHTAAMQLLRAGVDTAVIALWLGHERVETTQMYLHADLKLKEEALARTKPLATKPGRFRPSDSLLAFLESL